MKRLFVCCDGTWNSDSDEFQGVPVPTNVVRFFNALSEYGDDGVEQLRYYHVGVGANERWVHRIIDGALGIDLSRDIRTAYKWLSDHYVEDAEIFVIGFSRGAFTARSLVGMLHHCGLPHDASWALVKQAWNLYRLDPKIPANLSQQQRFRIEHGKPPPVRFLGVWETVGALGIPEIMNLFGLPRQRFEFHDTTLSPEVERAVQGLAIDEQRNNFSPTLWTDEDGCDPARVTQVWFPGVHADVGGGYKETGLSDATLKWMIAEAEQCGAVFEPDMLRQLAHADQSSPSAVHGVLHNSLTGFYRRIGFRPRAFPYLVKDSRRCSESVSPLTLARQASPPIFQAPYRPNIDPVAAVQVRVFASPLWNWTGIFMKEGVRYRFNVPLGQTWLDGDNVWGAEGTPGNWVQRLSGWARRVRTANWFELCGAIIDPGLPGAAGAPPEPFYFRIGRQVEIKAPCSGYLYCFANDASWAYWNNQGSLRVEIAESDAKPAGNGTAYVPSGDDLTAPATAPGGSGAGEPS
ncbi:DUF2235 domain-containing protein [Paraburkholderia metrosideri]|uniref:T6SS Phospholipase effector Tle1-like catalytic domain-containing protein n=1 Tax=Paraburkholderia metrosideri TaxID=580937 RepID=A0ABN7ID73_9BURK|nr:DUF2235 domain-containing protein [Paraburkholderia metrosideri]CAD6555375.1 hypothetical protein LMG28140_05678 [Paraburkholderia metrosideri]